ncbi:hypothetical protein GCM10010112_65760 [Actinoplanes lobatus]|uniref:Uncharacterized protein n=1 Tax=Actinoplanes lobatus TaxID=113568 RepID=A0A7W7HK06_9ACTN|nr:hypothetical protein [Actinoplanes lobatus]MBB4751948.1 hypothetical protein [Actinoplanes lobatus]GGN85389.1 hypothetical protein GCM10010112_65760 [Actinoplanes lobatus]GIE44325.1 hypothetical protein Alo02nite_72230 [Actinoplanes lobatus]
MSDSHPPRAPRREHCASCGTDRNTAAGVDALALALACPACTENAVLAVTESVAAAASPVDALHEDLQRLLGERDGISIQVLRPESAVTIVLASGYRWQVYPPFTGVIRVSAQHAALYGPDLAPVPGMPLITLISLENMRDLLISTESGPVAELIDADLITRMEADLFDPDTLLGEGH